MKYLRLFEDREFNWKYLSDEDTLILKDFVDSYISKLTKSSHISS